MHYLNELNDEQKKAVLCIEGPVLVIAGAGTGKTKMLTHRIYHLITTGVEPKKILAITFTNKAAEEMRERVYTMLQNDQEEKPSLLTFHSLGLRILREQHHVLGLSKYFNIIDAQDSLSRIKESMKEEGFDIKEWEPKKIIRVISREKNKGFSAETFVVKEKNPLLSVVAPVWKRYEAKKKQEGSLDFDDLLFMSWKLLSENENIRSLYQNRWQHILVDEYQDTNTLQYKIVKTLSEKHKNICAVGDGDQNIYSWRGADMRNILNFEKDFPGTQVIILNQNYRSTQIILDVADAIISKNTERIEKKLTTQKQGGENISVYAGFNEYQESQWIARTIQKHINEGYQYKDIAILFRTNFQSRVLEEGCLEYGIPYQVIGTKFFERKEIKDIIAYLRAALNPASLSDIKRIINEPKRGIGTASIVKIFAGKSNEINSKAQNSYQQFLGLLQNIREYTTSHPPHESLKYIIEHSGIAEKMRGGSVDEQERLENMKELVSYAKKYSDSELPYESFFEQVALLSDQDTMNNKKEFLNTVKLMTIHASKGLEFPLVFVAGLEQGLFPSHNDEQKNKYESEEERRLCYVAYTRAKEKLFLSYAYVRTIYGQQRINEVSEFISDIPEHLIKIDEQGDDTSDDIQEYLIF